MPTPKPCPHWTFFAFENLRKAEKSNKSDIREMVCDARRTFATLRPKALKVEDGLSYNVSLIWRNFCSSSRKSYGRVISLSKELLWTSWIPTAGCSLALLPASLRKLFSDSHLDIPAGMFRVGKRGGRVQFFAFFFSKSRRASNSENLLSMHATGLKPSKSV